MPSPAQDISITYSNGRTVVNGKELPTEFGTSPRIAGKLVVSQDNKLYVDLSEPGEKLNVHNVPANGTIESYDKSSRYAVVNSGGRTQIQQSTSGVNQPSVIARGTVTISNGPGIGQPQTPTATARTTYIGVTNFTVNFSGDVLTLGTSSDRSVRLTGSSSGSPSVQNGRLTLNVQSGLLLVPREATITINAENATISGEVSSSGSIRTTNGNITLRVPPGLSVQGTTTNGTSSVPANIQIKAGEKSLSLSTTNGNITVDQ